MENRIRARNEVHNVFARRREALGVRGPFDFSLENRVKRQFMKEMNAISKDLEMEAMARADKGKGWDPVVKKAE